MTAPVKSEKNLVDRLRAKYRWLDHLVRAGGRYVERYGDHYAAAITYYSVLSLIPMLMLGFSIAGYVLAGNTELLDKIKDGITTAVPGEFGGELNKAITGFIGARNSVGIFGLLAAAYSGLGWMTSLRDALTAQWTRSRPELPFFATILKDLLVLLCLGLALLVSFGITAAGSVVGPVLLDLVGLADTGWATALLTIGSVLLGLLANWLVFLWVLTSLPRYHVGVRSAMRGAVAGAVGFELLKQIGSIYIGLIKGSPTSTVFGSVLGLLVFVNLVSRFLVFITAWTATATENLARSTEPEPEPLPVFLRPTVRVGGSPDATAAAGLLGVGALAGVVLSRLFRRP
ncbi:inner membrane protein YhjD [Kutzneria viridogrisea]|uniref:Membrane protein n=1 Tax=Kutzneria viridogrisea TaxID=47990 RepID=A0ABR6BWT3_9PSEU|nr:membrane protein [Kutzneria viridogrisea]